MPSPRPFPPPWTIEELNDACFIVSEANGQSWPTFISSMLGSGLRSVQEETSGRKVKLHTAN
jgi:hypothetical protein